ncbi:MAG: hypothetical protein GX226_06005 [Dehalococcoidales bacterium]|jgi:uncharacterized membrane protein HdeD (DUF308 family)|nr:hypothetical protein [Dehalococcoidales bacterium]
MFDITPPILIIVGIVFVLFGIIAMVWPKKAVYIISATMILVGAFIIVYSLD